MRYACNDRMCGAEDCETCHPGCNDDPETVEMWCPTCEERVDMKEDDDGECPRCGDEVMDEEPDEKECKVCGGILPECSCGQEDDANPRREG
jgi:DNA-directed RNA polymerase subunit RPC12/RpoP